MSYNVLSHSHWELGQFFGGGGGGGGGSLKFRGGGEVKKKDSFPILGLQRLVSLLRALSICQN